MTPVFQFSEFIRVLPENASKCVQLIVVFCTLERHGRTDVKYQTHKVWMYWYESIGRIQYIFLSFQAKLRRNLNSYVISNFISLAKPFLNLAPLAAWLEATVFAQPDPVNWESEWMSIKIATYEESCITEITPTNDRVAILNSTWKRWCRYIHNNDGGWFLSRLIDKNRFKEVVKF